MVGTVIREGSNRKITTTHSVGVESQVLANLGNRISLLYIDVVTNRHEFIGKVEVALTGDANTFMLTWDVDVIKRGVREKVIFFEEGDKFF